MHNFVELCHLVASIVATASVVANFLPPASTYDDYPRFKRFYETWIVKTVAATSVSIRAHYPSLAVPMFGLRQDNPCPPTAKPAPPEEKQP